MPPDKLLAMYESTPAARKLFASIVQAGVEDNRTTVDELIEDGEVTRRQAITLLRDLDEAGYGEFKVGRKGHPSRLEWGQDPRALAQRLLNGEPAARSAAAEFASAAAVAGEEQPSQVEEPVEHARGPAAFEHHADALEPHADLAEPEPEPEPPPQAQLRAQPQAQAQPQPQAQARAASERPRELFAEMFPTPEPASRSRKRERKQELERQRDTGQIEHTYVLRPKLRVVVELPEDLSAREAEILADWIRNLSFER